MMALLTESYCRRYPDTLSAIQVASYYAYQIAEGLVPAQHKTKFDLLFKPKLDLLPRPSLVSMGPSATKETKFYTTPSRMKLEGLIEDLMELQIH